MKKYAIVVLVLSVVMVSTMFSAASASMVVNDPRIKISNSSSSNWSGYAVQTNLATPQSGVVTDVKGTWVVPAVDPNFKTARTYSSFWVGIDGYSSNSVEQIGTDSDTDANGRAVYYAWYEMYPKYPVNLKMTILPGDTISAEVQYQGKNSFVLSITDTRNGVVVSSFSTTQKTGNVARSSAEWIAEAPSSRSGVLPLTDFNAVTFTSCSATINGHTGTISDAAWQDDAITMATSSGTIKAQPYILTAGGSSFTVNWLHT